MLGRLLGHGGKFTTKFLQKGPEPAAGMWKRLAQPGAGAFQGAPKLTTIQADILLNAAVMAIHMAT